MSWPLVRTTIGDQVYFQLKDDPTVEECPVLFVYNLCDWLASQTCWEGPLARWQRHPKHKSIHVGMGISKGGARTILKYAAQRAFFDMTKSALQALAGELGVEIDAADTTLERCKRLILHILGHSVEIAIIVPTHNQGIV